MAGITNIWVFLALKIPPIEEHAIRMMCKRVSRVIRKVEREHPHCERRVDGHAPYAWRRLVRIDCDAYASNLFYLYALAAYFIYSLVTISLPPSSASLQLRTGVMTPSQRLLRRRYIQRCLVLFRVKKISFLKLPWSLVDKPSS